MSDMFPGDADARDPAENDCSGFNSPRKNILLTEEYFYI